MDATLFDTDLDDQIRAALAHIQKMFDPDGFVQHCGHCDAAPDVYIGRTFAGRDDTGYGNPVTLTTDTARGRAQVLIDHFTWLQGPDPRAGAVRRRIRSGELTGRTLGCWCAPKPCHGWTLTALAHGRINVVKTELAALTGLLGQVSHPGSVEHRRRGEHTAVRARQPEA